MEEEQAGDKVDQQRNQVDPGAVIHMISVQLQVEAAYLAKEIPVAVVTTVVITDQVVEVVQGQ